MGEFEDALAALRAQDLEDDSPLEILEKFKASELRKKAQRADALEAENAELKSKVHRAEVAPKITEALKSAGVDFDSLRPAEYKTIDALEFEGDEPGEDWVAKVVSEYGFPLKDGAGVRGDEDRGEPPAKRIAGQAKGAPAGGGSVSSGITLDQYNEWSLDSRRRFRDEKPDEFRKLREDGVVTGVVFTP